MLETPPSNQRQAVENETFCVPPLGKLHYTIRRILSQSSDILSSIA